jgi:threonyl-tRNA synthetase
VFKFYRLNYNATNMADAVKSVVEGVKQVALGKENEKKQNAPKKEKKAKKGGDAGADAGPLELNPAPAYIDYRLEMFDKLYAEYEEELKNKPREPITITLGDGNVKQGTSWETTPAEIAKGISNSLFKRTMIARLDGEELWDLERPLEKSCNLELLPFDHEKGKEVFWHSSAHVLGEASERRFGCNLCFGPPIENGFFYDMAMPDNGVVQQSDWKPLETLMGKFVKEKQKFQRLVMTKENLKLMFKDNKYKQHYINTQVPDGGSTTVYRNGPFIDYCRGPHIPDTGRIEAFMIEKNSASYFMGKDTEDSLQRVYGISFPDKKLLAEHKKFLEEAEKRNHRVLGQQQELFFFHELSPGSAMWLPHGTRVYNTLLEFMRSEYRKRNYQEVITPNMYNSKLWHQSGHWQNYKDDMFTFEVEKEQWALKPMNCPGHFLMFAHRNRSHQELPIRMADFGVLHRNEASGALSGLTRVRRFQQDDAHIFCTEDQVETEIEDIFDFLRTVYGLFGFTFKMKLSTRPDNYMGERKVWDMAEARLQSALEKFSKAPGGVPWELNEGDGAFYGPKIDITISDSLKRDFQCATIQLDFQGPQNFSLEYVTSEAPVKTAKPEGEEEKKIPAPEQPKETAVEAAEAAADAAPGSKDKAPYKRVIKALTPGHARPVIIHRAIFGSVERFTGILIEHFAGKWPFWLSPRQILVIPVGVGFMDYAREVREIFNKEDFWVDVDESGNTLQKKIRTGQLAQYNFIFGKLMQ